MGSPHIFWFVWDLTKTKERKDLTFDKRCCSLSSTKHKLIHSVPSLHPRSPQKPCYLEPNQEALKQCPFNATYPMKFLIYGFTVVLTPDQQFVLIKNQLLASFDYNVIIVNWTSYNQPPYTKAVINTQLVGRQLSNLIKYLEVNKGVDPQMSISSVTV
ncbi:inactive pancreatic lipase-related protein 1 [Caerostris extrusa]|uniref:Inactive pancreatic lipase-related protein 1 n=1 Tax=Caerostris extrusa TaxID=172846 RepID=A0AAV4T3U0_CAEEX|nr:inactive pancreatic lipase-related protein 1 [Caerostris extrusa]